MIKIFKKIFLSSSFSKSVKKDRDRRWLEVRVEKGANKAIKEYRQVFEKLAEYDRS